MARDACGARFVLIAPFSDPGQPADPDHWYGWDLDWCADGPVVAAGAYGSAAEALAEWRAFAGPSAAELVSCPPELGIRLLDPARAGSLQGESVFGDEPAEFLREIGRDNPGGDTAVYTASWLAWVCDCSDYGGVVIVLVLVAAGAVIWWQVGHRRWGLVRRVAFWVVVLAVLWVVVNFYSPPHPAG